MKRTVMLVSVAAGLVIASAAAVVLFRARPLSSAGAHGETPASPNPPSSGHQAVAAIASATPTNSSAPVGAATDNAGDGRTEGGRIVGPLDPLLKNPAEQTIHQRVADAVRGQVPEAVPLFIQPNRLPPGTQESEVLAALGHVLDAAQSASPAEQPPFLLAADFLAVGVSFRSDSPETKQHVDRMARYGLTYEYGELGGGWFYTHSLLKRVQRDFRDSPWSEDAVVLLLELNCVDAFRVVIREGESSLNSHPQGRYGLETSYLVAQAYETWWSLSRATTCRDSKDHDCEENVAPDMYREGAEEARQKAVSYYERVLEIAKAGNMADDARSHLDHLRHNVDTGQRRFYCEGAD